MNNHVSLPQRKSMSVFLAASVLTLLMHMMTPFMPAAAQQAAALPAAGTPTNAQGAWMLRPPAWWSGKVVCASFPNLPGCPKQVYWA